MFIPTNEQGVIVRFVQECTAHDCQIESINTSYPDATILHHGNRWLVEFEYKSSNFLDHGHDIRKCDMIICWTHDYRECPLPVLALSEPASWGSFRLSKPPASDLEIEYWKRRALKAERRQTHAIPKNEQRKVVVSSEVKNLAEGGLSQREIAKILNLSQPKVNRLLKKMNQEGTIHVNGNGVKILKG